MRCLILSPHTGRLMTAYQGGRMVAFFPSTLNFNMAGSWEMLTGSLPGATTGCPNHRCLPGRQVGCYVSQRPKFQHHFSFYGEGKLINLVQMGRKP